MTEKSQRERAEQEELMARGPVSRGASNKDAPIDQHAGDQQEAGNRTTESTGPDPEHPDYNKTLQEHSTGDDVGSGSASKRDLGTVGGGTIPRTGTGPRGGMNTSNSTEAAGGTSARQTVGGGLPTDRGGLTDVGASGQSTNDANQIDRHAQASAGGRTPGQPQTSMGDRDASQANRGGKGTNEEIIDPMTSRAPSKLGQKEEEHTEQKKHTEH